MRNSSIQKWLEMPISDSDSPHALVSSFEMYMRFSAILIISSVKKDHQYDAQVGDYAGLGGWLGAIRRASKLKTEASPLSLAREKFSSTILNIWAEPVSGAPQGVSGVKALRDYLNHGGPLSEDQSEICSALASTVQSLRDAVKDFLAGAELTTDPEDTACGVGVLIHGVFISLYPLVYVDGNPGFLLYAGGGAFKTAFHRIGGRASAKISGVSTPDIPKGIFRESSASQPQVDSFRATLLMDLGAFSESGFPPVSTEDDATRLRFYWRKADSGETEDRRDDFRLGADDVRQWLDPDRGWVAYSTFLRKISNWTLVARRLGASFDSLEEDNRLTESEFLEDLKNPDAHVPSEFDVSMEHVRGSRTLSVDDLFSSFTLDTAQNVGMTTVTFMDGVAGSGKTRTMLAAARDRAKHLQTADIYDSPVPLFLYVSSTGRVLDNLKTVVDAAVVPTLNLTADRVKALARSGLLTVLIDGFDELLGNSSYGDALGSLKPWIEDLGGRGALVVSARSSYYESQYKESIKRNGDLLVKHQVARLRLWTTEQAKKYISDAGGDPTVLSVLSEDQHRLARVPLFARMLATLSLEEVTSSEFSLPGMLINGYVARESTKFEAATGSGERLLEASELALVFQEIALLMAGEAKREVDSESLLVAANDVLPGGIESRRGLSVRLPYLCGLSAETDGNSARFSFTHTVLFDEFFSARIARFIENGETRFALAALSYDEWRPETIDSLSRRVGKNAFKRFVDDASAYVHDSVERQGKESQVLRVNLGSLWNHVFRSGDSIDAVVSNAIFVSGVSFVSDNIVRIRFNNCRIESLDIPSGDSWNIGLRGTSVGTLRVESSGLSRLADVDSAEIESVLTATSYDARPTDVISRLRQLGVQGLPANDAESTSASLKAEIDQFLQRVESQNRAHVILNADRTLAQDGRYDNSSLWQLDQRDFARMVRQFEECGLAKCANMSARGPAKVRLRFEQPIPAIRSRSGQGIALFWAEFD